MIVKRCGKLILGCELSKDERAALDKEIRKSTAEWDQKHAIEIDAMYLYLLMTEYGFGEKRLHDMFVKLWQKFDEMRDRYDMDAEDIVWLYTKKLKDKGIDVEAWANEMETITVRLD